MHPDKDEAPLTLTKWPFYLGDGLLVGLAITIATLDNWELEGIEVFACVLAVALGAALLVFPFVTEYLMFAREETEDREAELSLLKKQLENTEAALMKQHERIRELESRSGLDDQRYELLTSAIDQKTQIELPDLTALTERLEAIEASAAEQAKEPNKVKKELNALRQLVEQAVDSLEVLRSRVNILEENDQQPSINPAEKMVEKTSETAASRKRKKKKEASLLKRAIQEKQDTASTAVSRIIDFESKSAASSGEEEAADSSKPQGKEEAPENETVEAEETETEETETHADSQAFFSEMEALPEDFSVSLGTDLMMDDDLFDAGEIDKPKKSIVKKAKQDAASKKKKAATEKLAVTTVEVNKLMGIGNKPFIRGSGAGLSWDKGVEMEFQEIGRWDWSAPASLDESIDVQIYRNDQDADHKGKYTLEPGQRLEIAPEF